MFWWNHQPKYLGCMLYKDNRTGEAGGSGCVEVGDECAIPWALGETAAPEDIGFRGSTGGRYAW